MTRTSTAHEFRSQLVEVAKGMLMGEENMIQGVRRICSLRFAIGEPDNKIFLALCAVESETDSFPLGAMRERCSAEYLSEADRELKAYLIENEGIIRKACGEIVNTYSE